MSMLDSVWIVDDDRSIRWVLEKALQQEGLETTSFDNGNSLLSSLHRGAPSAIITDIRMPGIDGLELLSKVSTEYPELPVIVMTAHSDLDSAVASYQGGAFEYLPKPFDVDDAVSMIKRAVIHAKEKEAEIEIPPETKHTEIIGGPALGRVIILRLQTKF